MLPNIATWWCGGPRQAAHVAEHLDTLLIAPAFGPRPLGLPDGARTGASLSAEERATLLTDMAKRPQDYVGQEMVRLSTMPVVIGDRLEPRPSPCASLPRVTVRGGGPSCPAASAGSATIPRRRRR
ncbi:hypothetical protein GCM10020258_24720 [Sphingomonas yabuuchiae]